MKIYKLFIDGKYVTYTNNAYQNHPLWVFVESPFEQYSKDPEFFINLVNWLHYHYGPYVDELAIAELREIAKHLWFKKELGQDDEG